MSDPTCSIEGCVKPVSSRGWCLKHYTRWRRHGSPLDVKLIHNDPKARLLSFVTRNPVSHCWEWTGSLTPTGYAQMRLEGKLVGAHRASYELLVGRIPAGKDIDHVCRNRRCVNPDHLEPVTHSENIRRSWITRKENVSCAQNGYSLEVAG